MPGFDLGHIMVVFVVAFLVLGPERLAGLARRAGQLVAEGQKANAQFARAFQEGLEGKGPEPGTQSELATFANDLRGHISELRNRLIISLVAIVLLTSVSYVFSDTILYILRAPAGDIKLRAFSPMDGFLVHFRVALYGGIFLTAPVWIYQLMRFILPGLMPNERRWVVPGVVGMVALFLLGNIFGYMMLQNMTHVLFGMFGTELEYFPSADQYISFVVYFLLATGIAFEVPLVLVLLMKLGLLSPETLKKQRKVAYFIIFVFAELITPVADPIVAPTIVMIPMVVLFEGALFISRFIVPKPKPASTTVSSNAS